MVENTKAFFGLHLVFGILHRRLASGSSGVLSSRSTIQLATALSTVTVFSVLKSFQFGVKIPLLSCEITSCTIQTPNGSVVTDKPWEKPGQLINNSQDS
jgi:hypothetical protein